MVGAKSALAVLSDAPLEKLRVRRIGPLEKVPQRSETSMGLTGKVQLKGKY